MSVFPVTPVRLAGVPFQPLSEPDLLDRMDTSMAAGEGGWVITANVDILRRAVTDPDSRRLVEAADVVVADGAPLVWASRLAGQPATKRVPGADLIWTMSEVTARRGGSVFVAGGPPGAAEAAAATLALHYPGLKVAGSVCPPVGFELDPEAVAGICAIVAAAEPDLVLVGMGFPKQERLIEHLRLAWPNAWYLGCGAAVNFAAGTLPRAPAWMRRSGLEWLHRLALEPRRLARRYLLDGVPFALRLLLFAVFERIRLAHHERLRRRS